MAARHLTQSGLEVVTDVLAPRAILCFSKGDMALMVMIFCVIFA